MNAVLKAASFRRDNVLVTKFRVFLLLSKLAFSRRTGPLRDLCQLTALRRRSRVRF